MQIYVVAGAVAAAAEVVIQAILSARSHANCSGALEIGCRSVSQHPDVLAAIKYASAHRRSDPVQSRAK